MILFCDFAGVWIGNALVDEEKALQNGENYSIIDDRSVAREGIILDGKIQWFPR